jgi:uncharacterized membrane protein
MHKPDEIATKLFGVPYEALDSHAQKVARHVALRMPIARNSAKDLAVKVTLGQRAADRVASMGGSWAFVGVFMAAMLLWVGLNTFLMVHRGRTFDPYPYILLNLFLSLLAAIQAPIILMSQNRHAQKDRIHAEHDYEVNLKAELEIMLLNEKIDLLQELQRQQLKLLTTLSER